ncbi:FemAB family XrtA/PEP-CTERM system-associated protein [Sphingomonas sp. 28-62-11]|uniref:FemAB family XrtA/PEP-CTERM system-associated protein n=1 Tax=Sphingomonas sp. 28-62-11 TaxID=1970432 RepID=UPI000BCF5352|nr:MAG: FemAB [Sphingomonas sp. 28-62-11]
MTMPLLAMPLGLRAADLHDAADRARIAAFVRAHPDATPFHLPEWSIAVAHGCGQRAHCLVAERANGDIVGILPLTEISSPLFGRALVSTGFGVGGGILATGDDAVQVLGEAGWALAERLHCPTMELRGGPIPEGDWQIDSTTYLGFARDLAANDDAELAAIPRKQRAEVRKGLGNGLEVTTGCHDTDLDAHYCIYSQSVRNLGTPVFPKRLFRETLREFGESADILVVWDGEKPVAGVLSLYMNGVVYPYWGGGTQAARGLRANDLMYFALMGHARRRGCTRFDFGRSKAGTGPAAFKKNWGFDGQPLHYAKRAPTGQQPREINPMSPRYRLQVAAWRKLPLWMANTLGPMIARGLG